MTVRSSSEGDRTPSALLRRRIAFSLDAPEGLAPYLERVFEPLSSLGAMPRRTATLLADTIAPGPRTCVLDAGCGKGTVAVEVARRLGCRVIGFDAMPAFLREARERARCAGVAHLCGFEATTAEAFFRKRRRFDAAMMLNLWPAPRALAALRRAVKRGGHIIIDDATRDPRRSAPPGLRDIPTLEDMNRRLERHGDRVLRAIRPAPSAIRSQNESLYRRLARSAHRLVGDRPDLQPLVRELLRRQREANHLLTTTLRPTLWLIRRG